MPVPAKQSLVPLRAPARLVRFPRARPLVGRDADVARVLELVERGERLITVLGSPGIGKTSLVTCAAERLSARLPGWFCDLSNQRSEADLCMQVSSVLGEVSELLGPALLVLDNFEQLTAASTRVLEWLDRAPELTIIVTSRERLAVDRECVVELEPLAVEEGAELFKLRAEHAGGVAGDDGAIAEIVRRLDGIPLAIELAAARTRLLSPGELAKRLRQGDDVLELGKRSPARHKTLADAIEWSWQLLTEDEQRALVCCSVFAGSFSVAAAERLLSAVLSDSVPGGSALAALTALREKSLIHMASGDRLGLYLSIRQFAERKLPDLRSRAQREHARIYAEVAAQFTRSRLLLTRIAGAAGAWEDIDNLLAAFAHAEDAEIACALTFLGTHTPDLSGLRVEDPELAAIVHLARQHALVARGCFDEGLAEARRVEDLAVSPAMRAAACVRIGIQLRVNGDARGALRAHEQAAALATEESSLRAINTACMGRLMCDLRDLDGARRLNDEASAICERVGEHWLASL
ncbi:MAG TPA: AAA family ATPase, partial [Polyangiaceae bacterium]|nr:AAA family ATPase [Polyangiaceae bacterium]